jgi:hypothetical protein
MTSGSAPGWLLLIHQIPPKPPYLRAKIARRLQQVGAVAVKNSVYVLPAGKSTQEDFQWISREILKGGGEATICEARFVEGLTDAAVKRMFNDARDADYRELAREPEAGRLQQRLSEVAEIDFFRAPGRASAEAALRRLASRRKVKPEPTGKGRLSAAAHRGRTWVTRQGIHVDRIASAWLIRGFIDAKARFKFVPGKSYEPGAGELRFDMFEGEFTHEGENCSFETLVERFGLEDTALRAVAEIVHDIDLKDRKYKREEAAGIDRLIVGICMSHKDDRGRLEAGSTVFQSLYEYFRRKLS